MIKIFHMADLHLDSPFSGGDLRRSENGRRRLRDTFRRMTKYIRENGYELVLIPGDLYDVGYITPETAEMIRQELASLGCPVVISPGNHDPYCKGSLYEAGGFSENVHIFKDENVERLDIDSLGVSVYGYAFTSSVYRSDPLSEVATDPNKINILCAHCELDSPLSSYAPVKFADIEALGFSYAALGHVHKAPEPKVGERATAAYCGFAEGRAFDEIGRGGALSVTVFETGESTTVRLEKLSFSEYSFEILDLNVSSCGSDSEISECVLQRRAECGYGRNTALRIVLNGALPSDFIPNTSEILSACSADVDYAEIIDKTLPTADDKSLMGDMTLRGEFYRAMKKKYEEEGADIELISAALRIGLSAIEGRELGVFLPCDSNSAKNTDESEEG